MKKQMTQQNKQILVSASSRIPPEWIEEAKYYDGGISEFLREAVYHYKDNRHLFKFHQILEMISGELLILSAWKEKGHPCGAKWTDRHEQMLHYYERCFEILLNSPFNE
ncbi:MAG: hypothetical protein PHS38_11820 [Bacteroidales bacterium]|nr:hypothetical protein [Bacteroidales bacterium]